MKKEVKFYVLSVFLTFFSVTSSAQKVEQFIGPWIQGGLNTIVTTPGVPDDPEAKDKEGNPIKNPYCLEKNTHGGGGSLGCMYELRLNRHFLVDAGIGFKSTWNRFSLQDDRIADTLRVNMTDAYWSNSLQIPLMIGGQWKNFYFLAGVKYDQPVFTQSVFDGKMKYTAVVDTTLIPRDVTSPWVHTKDSSSFKPNLTASLEIGFRLGEVFEATGFDVPKQNIQYRLALFADFNVLDFHKLKSNDSKYYEIFDVLSSKEYGGDCDLPVLDENNMPVIEDGKPKMNHISAPVYRSFMVGLKFTVFFRLHEKRGGRVYRDTPMRSSYGILE